MTNSPAFATQTLQVVTAATKVVHGKTISDWSNPVAVVTIEGCSIQPIQGTDNTDHRDADLHQWVAYVYDLVKGATVKGSHHVLHAGLEFEVVGPPQPLVYGMSSDHFLLNLRVWEEH